MLTANYAMIYTTLTIKLQGLLMVAGDEKRVISRNFWLCVCINRGFDLYRNSMVMVPKLNDSGRVQLYTY